MNPTKRQLSLNPAASKTMKQLAARLVLFLAIAAAGQGVQAQSDLSGTLKDSVGAHWIYDDFAQAKARAKQTGQPLLVLFRCVP